MNVPGLRSPHEKVSGIHYIGRMFDKIRLHAAGKLPEEYHANLGGGFDARAILFLGIDYTELSERVREGGGDEELMEWCFTRGTRPTDEQIEVWNGFMAKRGWRDELSPILQKRLREGGFADRTDVQTMFDFLDLDEGRDPRERAAATAG